MLNGDLAGDFHRGHPGFTHTSPEPEELAPAAQPSHGFPLSQLPLCRLRYGGYASTWGFAIYRASHDDYQDGFLPSGQPAGTPKKPLDCACGLYLGDPAAWLTPPGTDTPTDLQAGAPVVG